MPLPSSGAISLNDIHVEAGGSSGTTASINDSDIRGLINKASGATMSFSDFYGASSNQPVSFVGSAIVNYPQPDDWFSGRTLDLTSAGVQNGDLVVIAMSADNTYWNASAGPGIVGMSNITVLYNGLGAGTPSYLVAYGYWQSGDSNPYGTMTNSNAFDRDWYSIVGAVFRNANTSLLNSAITTATTGMPNPPSLGSVSGTKIIIATGHLDDDDIYMTAGSGYSLAGAELSNGGFAGGSATAIQYKITSTSTTEDPPAFGGGMSDSWAATTLRF